jgi:hypothetical protein
MSLEMKDLFHHNVKPIALAVVLAHLNVSLLDVNQIATLQEVKIAILIEDKMIAPQDMVKIVIDLVIYSQDLVIQQAVLLGQKVIFKCQSVFFYAFYLPFFLLFAYDR